ncbi:carbohydrate ABC transporter permease [Demequina litorisediminis]|uniref:Trehalose transport system permease protein SugB n=1 Tax=Demequina litorisediminis TaxID=1849022 RepID=A0ABQ6IBD3_9MICO|nr:hypothetical protein GCM10025876_07650 [Demequina litorisediminis]
MTATAASAPASAPRKSVAPPHRRYARGEGTGKTPWLSIAVALVGVAVTLGPIIYLVVGGLRTQQDLSTNPTGLPDPVMWSNYGDILSNDIFWRQAANSLLVATLTTAGVVLFGTMAAYPLARYRFKGREGVFMIFTTGLMFPLSVAVLPLYLLLKDMGLSGLPGLIVPQIAFGLPMTIIILRPFLKALPLEARGGGVHGWRVAHRLLLAHAAAAGAPRHGDGRCPRVHRVVERLPASPPPAHRRPTWHDPAAGHHHVPGPVRLRDHADHGVHIAGDDSRARLLPADGAQDRRRPDRRSEGLGR